MANWAAEIRIRAERRLGEMLKAQKEAGGMNTGTKGQLSGSDSSGSRSVKPPENTAPTLTDLGISNSMSSMAKRNPASAGFFRKNGKKCRNI